eukprot:scaffold36333_cov46-Prasinocladus_malaysianus.AAC.2
MGCSGLDKTRCYLGPTYRESSSIMPSFTDNLGSSVDKKWIKMFHAMIMRSQTMPLATNYIFTTNCPFL